MKSMHFPATLAALTLLAGCMETGTVPEPGNSVEAQARSVCVRDVRAKTGNQDVIIQSSRFSEAGTQVILLVDGTGTWQCYAYSDGTTDRIMSLTNEGSL